MRPPEVAAPVADGDGGQQPGFRLGDIVASKYSCSASP